jgi:hypothetical protein
VRGRVKWEQWGVGVALCSRAVVAAAPAERRRFGSGGVYGRAVTMQRTRGHTHAYDVLPYHAQAECGTVRGDAQFRWSQRQGRADRTAIDGGGGCMLMRGRAARGRGDSVSDC